MKNGTLLLPTMYFSYGQFMVYDEVVKLAGCAWKREQSAQGFARRESVVNFATILEFGLSDVFVFQGRYVADERYERVIAVPFLVVSGQVHVDGPEEAEIRRIVELTPGHYRLVAAQYGICEEAQYETSEDGERAEAIDLFFEPMDKPLERSAILVQDSDLDPPAELIETAGIAGK